LRPSVRRACDRDGVKGPGRDEGRGKGWRLIDFQEVGSDKGSDSAFVAVSSGRRQRPFRGQGRGLRPLPEYLIMGASGGVSPTRVGNGGIASTGSFHGSERAREGGGKGHLAR